MPSAEGAVGLDAELQAVFRRETEEQVAAAETALLALERDPTDGPAARALFRALHSLKGNAACVARADVEDFAHRLETALHPVREKQRVLEQAAIDALFPLLYALRDAALLETALPPADRIEALGDSVARARVHEQAPTNLFRIVVQYPGEPVPPGLDPTYVLQDLADLGEITAVVVDPESILPLARLENPDALVLRFRIELRTTRSIDEVRAGCFVFDEATRVSVEPIEEVAAPRGPAAGAGQVHTVRIEAARLDRLMNLASEVTITNARLRRAVADGVPGQRLLEIVDQLETHGQTMQDEVLGARMISIDELFRPFVRLVRELSTSLGKRVALAVEGADVELDKAIVEHMRDPLTHIVRNALDHGIEPPDERARAGKPPEGRITISARQREGSIYLVVRDDGRGLDRGRIREQAVRRGLVAPDAALSHGQIDQLIFESGLSTAARVTNLSGRGVGMDIVRKSIEQIHGEVRVESAPGAGCTFRIRLPLTLAIIEGMLAAVGDETIVVPVHAIAECLELRTDALSHGVLNVRGEPLPYVRLRERFGAVGPPPGREQVIIVGHEGTRVGLVVDALLGGSQTVIKPLGRLFEALQIVSGATVLWSGRVALILDVPGLVREASSGRQAGTPASPNDGVVDGRPAAPREVSNGTHADGR